MRGRRRGGRAPAAAWRCGPGALAAWTAVTVVLPVLARGTVAGLVTRRAAERAQRGARAAEETDHEQGERAGQQHAAGRSEQAEGPATTA